MQAMEIFGAIMIVVGLNIANAVPCQPFQQIGQEVKACLALGILAIKKVRQLARLLRIFTQRISHPKDLVNKIRL